MIPLVLAVSLLLPQRPVMQRPAPPSSARDSAISAARQAITDVGLKVADVRTAHDALRRAVFNFPDAVVIQRAQEMRQRCQDLTALARTAARRVCRSCFSATIQPPVDGYRAGLPEVGQVGTRCASQVSRSLSAKSPADAVRRGIWALGNTLVQGFAPYETRLQSVRHAFGLGDVPARAPRP